MFGQGESPHKDFLCFLIEKSNLFIAKIWLKQTNKQKKHSVVSLKYAVFIVWNRVVQTWWQNLLHLICPVILCWVCLKTPFALHVLMLFPPALSHCNVPVCSQGLLHLSFTNLMACMTKKTACSLSLLSVFTICSKFLLIFLLNSSVFPSSTFLM